MSFLTFTQASYVYGFQNNNEIKRFSDTLHDSFKRSLNPSDEFYKNAIILSGNANPELAKGINQLDYFKIEIADYLHTSLGKLRVQRFKDGESRIEIVDTVRGKDIYIIQPTCPPVNENLMDLLLLVTTLRRASARKINVVIPYYGYSRQYGRETLARVPISSADVARLLELVGIDRLIAVDLHCGQIQGFFGPRVPVDNLDANLVALNYLKHQNKFNFQDIVLVSPDAAGVFRVKKFQDQLKSTQPKLKTYIAMIAKQREGKDKKSIMTLVGDVKNKDVLIIDDIIDTGNTINQATKILKEKGAQKVIAFATHGLFSEKALETIKNSPIDQVIVTNSIPAKLNEEEMMGDRIQRLSVAPLLAEAIYRIQLKECLDDLFQV